MRKRKSPIPAHAPHGFGFGFWLPFRRWLWGKTAIACVLNIPTPQQTDTKKPRDCHKQIPRKVKNSPHAKIRGARGARAPRQGLSPTKGGLTVAPFGISASRNRQSPPNFPMVSGFGYRSDGGFGEKLRWRAYLTFRLPNKQIQKKPRDCHKQIPRKVKNQPHAKSGGARGARAPRKGLSNCRSDGGFGEKLRWRAY